MSLNAERSVNKAIVFDLGNVLIDWDPRNLYRKLFTNPEEMERFLLEVCNWDFINATDAGMPMAQAVAALQSRWPRYHAEIAAFDTRWDEMLAGVNQGTLAIFRELKEQHRKVYALSNYSAEKFEFSKPYFPFFDWFDGMVISGYEGIGKPDSKIYQILLDRFGLEPATSVFIDDKLENVEAAQRLGFSTVHFRTAAELRMALLL